MTICCAAKINTKKGPVVLAASDSEVILSNERLLDIDLDSKLFVFGEAVVAMSGGGAVAEALEILLEDKVFMKKVKFKTRRDIRNFGKALFGGYKLLVEESVVTSLDETNVGCILVATPTDIWSIFADLSIFNHKSFFVTGSGDSIAKGILTVLLRRLGDCATEEDLRKVLTETIETTGSIVLGCGGVTSLVKPKAIDDNQGTVSRGRRPRVKSRTTA